MQEDNVSLAIAKAVNGLQIAFIHLGSILEQRNIISKTELATSFEATVAMLPADLKSRELSQKILIGIASGLREAHVPELKIVH